MGVGIVRHVEMFNRAAPGANTDIITADIKPNGRESMFRVHVVLATSSVFNYTVSDQEGSPTLFTVGINASAALNAGDGYTFDIPALKYETTSVTFGAAKRELTYNFRVETDGIIRVLIVDEIFQAV